MSEYEQLQAFVEELYDQMDLCWYSKDHVRYKSAASTIERLARVVDEHTATIKDLATLRSIALSECQDMLAVWDENPAFTVEEAKRRVETIAAILSGDKAVDSQGFVMDGTASITKSDRGIAKHLLEQGAFLVKDGDDDWSEVQIRMTTYGEFIVTIGRLVHNFGADFNKAWLDFTHANEDTRPIRIVRNPHFIPSGKARETNVPALPHIPTPAELNESRAHATSVRGVLETIARIMALRPELDKWEFDCHSATVRDIVRREMTGKGWAVWNVVKPMAANTIEVSWPK